MTTFLDAGAGTGKTTQLVRRVLRRVLEGDSRIDELAVITFTEKAAAELRDRVRLALTNVVAGHPADAVEGDPLPDDPDARARASDALAHLHQATICTLHAFAQRLLDEHDGDTRTTLLDGVDKEERFAERWERVAAQLLTDPTLSAALDRSVALGVELGHWRDVAAELDDQWDRCADWMARADLVPPVAPVALGRVIADLESVLADARRVAQQGEDKLATLVLENVPEVLDRLREAAGTGDDFFAAHALSGAILPGGNSGRKPAWGGDGAIESARARVRAPQRLLGEVALAAFVPILRHLAVDAVADGQRRVAERTLTYHDILVAARDLARTDPAARLAARRRYRALLIDEFQDTDPLQADLALALCWDGDTGLGDGDQAAPLPEGRFEIEDGRLHFVGDPKQSIYRFRRADVQAYERMKERFEDQVVPLQDNRRSRPVIVGWVNGVFRALMATDGQVAYRDLVAARPDVPLAGPGVASIGGPVDLGGADALRAAEAEAIVRTVHAALDGWEVCDPATGTVRRARPSDVALLLRTRSLLPDLGDALTAAQIPFRVESRGYAWSSQEIKDVLTILGAIADPADESKVVAALRNRAIGCSDDELLQWRTVGSRFSLVGPRPGDGNAVVAAGLDWLAGLFERRHRLDVVGLVRTVIAERHLMAAALACPRPRDAWARLQLVVDAADQFVEEDATATLRRFLQRCAWAEEQGAVSNERVVTEPDDDAVRILTIHAAKGLEFPIVIVAGLGLGTNHGTLRVRWAVDEHGDSEPIMKLEVRAGERTTDVDFRTRTFSAVYEDDKHSDALESERLAYVACTRARDHLVVSLFHKPVKKREAGDRRIAEDLSAAVTGAGTKSLDPSPVAAPTSAAGEGNVGAWERFFAEWDAALPVATEGTELRTRRAGGHDWAPVGGEAPNRPASYDGTAARRFGSAVHAVAEAMPFDDEPEVLDELVRRAAAANAVDDIDRVRRCVEALRATATWSSASAATRVWRELHLDGTIDGVAVSGQADLVWEQPDGTIAIADWKTEASGPDELRTRYADQLRSYGALVTAATGRTIGSATIVAIHPVAATTAEVNVP